MYISMIKTLLYRSDGRTNVECETRTEHRIHRNVKLAVYAENVWFKNVVHEHAVQFTV